VIELAKVEALNRFFEVFKHHESSEMVNALL
jgi:hypothetical protein